MSDWKKRLDEEYEQLKQRRDELEDPKCALTQRINVLSRARPPART